MISLKGLARAGQLIHGYVFDREATAQRDFQALIGLPFADPKVKSRDYETVLRQLDAVLASVTEDQHFPELCRQFDIALASGQRMENMVPHYAVLLGYFHVPFDAGSENPEYCEALLKQYAAVYHADPTSPAAAAIYAYALGLTGYSYRGNGWIKDVKQENIETMVSYARRAREILDATTAAAHGNLIWHWFNFKMGRIESVNQSELSRRFDALQALDPYNPEIYHERLMQLLPRWGGSYEEIEVFARQSATRTADKLGNLMYARINWLALSVEDRTRLLVSGEMMLEGLDDWLRLYPSQWVANLYASHAQLKGRPDLLRRLFENHIREIHQDAWFTFDQPLKAMKEAGLFDPEAANERILVARKWATAA
jgi:hypothetical protein